MIHLYETFVDIKEYSEQIDIPPSIFTKRYEVDANSKLEADKTALFRAGSEHPRATEFDVRTARILH
ncbi:MAG TPA: hypothetical protein V6D07_07315 [Trichocoleus sp.]